MCFICRSISWLRSGAWNIVSTTWSVPLRHRSYRMKNILRLLLVSLIHTLHFRSALIRLFDLTNIKLMRSERSVKECEATAHFGAFCCMKSAPCVRHSRKSSRYKVFKTFISKFWKRLCMFYDWSKVFRVGAYAKLYVFFSIKLIMWVGMLTECSKKINKLKYVGYSSIISRWIFSKYVRFNIKNMCYVG